MYQVLDSGLGQPWRRQRFLTLVSSHTLLTTTYNTHSTDENAIQVEWSADIYPVDTVLPVHIVRHDEATAKSTTKYGRR